MDFYILVKLIVYDWDILVFSPPTWITFLDMHLLLPYYFVYYCDGILSIYFQWYLDKNVFVLLDPSEIALRFQRQASSHQIYCLLNVKWRNKICIFTVPFLNKSKSQNLLLNIYFYQKSKPMNPWSSSPDCPKLIIQYCLL